MEAQQTLQMKQSLRNLGLSQYEIHVITYLFQFKKASSKEISKKAAIPFNMVQLAASSLVRRGILKAFPNQDDLFEICSSQHFQEWINSEKQKHNDIYSQASQDIKDYFKYKEDVSWQPQVLYYEGKEDLKELYNEMLEETANSKNKEIYSWQDIEKITEIFDKEYVKNHINERNSKNIQSHAILPDNKINQNHKNKSEKRNMKLAKELTLDGDIRIFNNAVSIVTFNEGKPIGFVFKGKVVTKLFRNIFKSFWKNLD